MLSFSKEKILKAFEPCDFSNLHENKFCDYLAPVFLDYFLYGLYYSESQCIKTGASKGAILLPHTDWVIKIPFRGSYREIYDDEIDDYEWEFCEFENAYNNKNSWDYCLRELEVYDLASKRGLRRHFAETEFLGEIQNYPIYIQRKADPIGLRPVRQRYSPPVYSSPEVRETLDSVLDEYSEIEEAVALYYIENYGVDQAQELINFLSHEDVRDLHGGNYGFIADELVMIDFSSYCEDC